MRRRARATFRSTASTAAIAIGFVLALSTCASAPPLAPCPVRALQKPAPAPACLGSVESRQFLLDSGHRIGDRLMGWRARPGEVTLAIEFAADASVQSVCLRDREGLVVASRVRHTAAEIRSFTAAPTCFANRRIEFAWESPTVTAYEIRRTEIECNAAADPLERHLDFCRWSLSCPVSEILRMNEEADDRVAQCVLAQIPIAIVAADTTDVALFLPADGTSPNARQALDSLAACDDRDRQADGVACMIQKGWRRIE